MFGRRLTKFLAYLAVLAAIAAGVARATVLRWWRVPSDDPYLEASVAPTLAGGDWVILWRMWKPKFGDLVLCPEPEAEGRVVIGRLVGTANDRVQIQNNHLRINGRPMHDESACSEPTFTVVDPVTRDEVEQSCDTEDLSGRPHLRGNAPASRQVEPVTLTADAGQGLLISDNRQFPYDSRDFGPVPLASCKESIVFRLISAKGFADVATRLSIVR